MSSYEQTSRKLREAYVAANQTELQLNRISATEFRLALASSNLHNAQYQSAWQTITTECTTVRVALGSISAACLTSVKPVVKFRTSPVYEELINTSLEYEFNWDVEHYFEWSNNRFDLIVTIDAQLGRYIPLPLEFQLEINVDSRRAYGQI